MLIRQNEFPYHIVTRSNNKDWFKADMDDVWNYFLDSIKHATTECRAEIHSYVLMSNHYHLMLTTPDSNIDRFMFLLNKKFSDLIRKNTLHINHKFSGRYKWNIVDNHVYLYNTYRYIYQNPIRANIVDKCEDYLYSSLRKVPIKVTSPIDLTLENTLDWLNEKMNERMIKNFKSAMRKPYFCPNNRLPKIDKNELTH